MMGKLEKTEFKMEDRIGDRPLTAENTSLPMLREFLGEVEALLKGNDPQASLVESEVRIESSSLKVVAMVESVLAASLNRDLGRLRETRDLDSIDPKRGEIIEKWQKRASKNPSRHYAIAPRPGSWSEVKADSGYSRKGEPSWVEVEKYLTGKIYNWGGKNKTNLHLELSETGQTLTINATEEQILREEKNYVYRTATVHVVGEQNLYTREFRNLQLLELVKPSEEVSPEELQQLWQKGKQAWKDVESTTAWVEKMRGNA